MPIYRVQAPNGQVLRFEGPEGASQDQVLQAAKEYMAAAGQPRPAEQEQPGIMQQIGEQAVGAGETALSTISGMTTGALGMAAAAGKTIAQQILDGSFGTPEAARLAAQAAGKGAEDFTYAPRTQAGQKMTETVGDVMSNVVAPIAPMAEFPVLTEGVGYAAQYGKAAGTVAAHDVAQAVKPAIAKAGDLAQGVKDTALGVTPQTPGTPPSAGAAGVDMATRRRANAESIGFTGDSALTTGQATRDLGQQRNELQTWGKDPELGKPIRERLMNQNAQAPKTLDDFIAQTGGAEPLDSYLRDVGTAVDKTLRAHLEKRKAVENGLWTRARNSPEAQQPIDIANVVKVINDNAAAEDAGNASILTAVKNKLIKMGGAVKNDDGTLTAVNPTEEAVGSQVPAPDTYGTSAATKRQAAAQPVTGIKLGDVEEVRKFINANMDNTGPNLHYGIELKNAIDAATEGKGGEPFRLARAASRKIYEDFKDPVLIKRLLSTKPNSEDRVIALENVLHETVFSPATSRDQLQKFRRVLSTGTGQQGQQAWKDLQAASIEYIKNQITKSVQRDERGNPVVSAAGVDKLITHLDQSGKLDFLYGPQLAAKMRTFNDVIKDIKVPVTGAVNHSETATMLAGLFDVVVSGSTGIPAPVASTLRYATKQIKDSRARAQIQQALGEPKQ